MGKKNRDSTKTDFSSFMCIILMLTGALVTIMIGNVVVISANPENIEITAVVTDPTKPVEVDEFGNVKKNPWYVEVMRDRMIIYPSQEIVGIRELENKDNGFERLLKTVEQSSTSQYVVLLVRPYAANIARQLKKVITDRELDVGVDLLAAGKSVTLMSSATNMEVKASSGVLPQSPVTP